MCTCVQLITEINIPFFTLINQQVTPVKEEKNTPTGVSASRKRRQEKTFARIVVAWGLVLIIR